MNSCFDFFSWRDKNPVGIHEICTTLEIEQRPADVMLTLFKALNLIEEREGLYYLRELSKEYLIESSPWSLGPYFVSLKERPICDDMFKDEFSEGFDVHLFSHVLHDWDFSDVKLKANAIQYLKWKNYWRGRAFLE